LDAARNARIAAAPEVLPPEPPGGSSVLRRDGRLYDAQRWMPGETPANAAIGWPDEEHFIDVPIVLPAPAFGEVMAFLARLHGLPPALAGDPAIPAAPLSFLGGAVRQAHSRHFHQLRPRARHEPVIQRWLATSERLLAAAEPVVVAAATERPARGTILHLGLWGAHVLSEQEHLSGILGWERISAGDPLLDIAQVMIRLQGWSDDAVEMGLGAYSEIRPLAPDERRLLPAIAALDAVATTGRMLEQVYDVERTDRPPMTLRAGIDLMLSSLTTLDRTLNAPSRVRKRTWVRKGPPPTPRPKGEARRERRRR
jgi:aminoglycoside phosphotransferase (APT) family kinase protein